MKRRRNPDLTVFCRVWLVAGALFCATGGAWAARPNFVLIFTDDQGINDVGCYGSEIPTPNIDRIAAEGIRFDSWYSGSAICTPSRFGLLTGRNPSRSRDRLLGALMFLGEEDTNRGIRSGETTIAQVLGEGGYETALIGKWHLGHGAESFLPMNHGFDRFIGHTGGCIDYFSMTYGILPDWYHQTEQVRATGYATDVITGEAVRYLEERAKAPGAKPFFLYLAYNAPHFGKGWSPADGKPVNLMQPQAADLKRVAGIDDKVRREFAAMTAALDDGVGRVLDALDALQLSTGTLVIFLTDHGGDPVYGGSNRPLRGDKATLFEGGIRVPCLMRWPGVIRPGTTCDALLWSLDLFPALVSLAGIDDSGRDLDGVDFTPLLRGAEWEPPERDFFWELGSHAELDRESWTALRSGNWKLVASPVEGELLFDLAADPNETTDLSQGHPGQMDRMKRRRDAMQADCRAEE